MVHINIIECKLLGDIMLSFKMTSKNSETPNISEKVIEIAKRDGYYSTYFTIDDINIYTIAINNDVNINDIPGERYIPLLIKKRYVEELRRKKLNQLMNNYDNN